MALVYCQEKHRASLRFSPARDYGPGIVIAIGDGNDDDSGEIKIGYKYRHGTKMTRATQASDRVTREITLGRHSMVARQTNRLPSREESIKFH